MPGGAARRVRVLPGASRTRVSAVVLAAFGMAVATFTGGVAAYAGGWLLLVAVLIFSYLSGLLATLGQRFQVVGLQWAIQLVIASAVPLPPGDAAVRAGGLVLAGGLWQGALVVASWAVTRGNQERTSLAGVYRALARYAEQNLPGGPRTGRSRRPPGSARTRCTTRTRCCGSRNGTGSCCCSSRPGESG